PLISILSHLSQKGQLPPAVEFLYGFQSPKNSESKSFDASKVLFLPRLRSITSTTDRISLSLFATGSHISSSGPESQDSLESIKYRRMTSSDIVRSLGPVEKRSNTVVYICGPPAMTDEFVDVAKSVEGIRQERVL
ncbi:MAG: hypothetical protein M4579_007644, partial [Chaenotheca gracillima]